MSKKFLYVDANGDYYETPGAYEESDFINVSTGASDAGKPIVLDAGGQIDGSMIDDSDIDHGSIGGLADDDHMQYILVDGTRAFTGDQSMGSNQLTSVGDPTASTIDAGSNDAVPMSYLASTSSSEGASVIGIEDASAYYSGDNVEAGLNELESQIGGDTSSTYDFTESNVLADNDAIYAALEKLDLKHGDYSSSANGEGASLINIEDSAGNFTSTEVEGALAELFDLAGDHDQEAATADGAISKGDLLYYTGNGTVATMAITTSNYCVGVALDDAVDAAPIKFARWDNIVTGVLTTATFGTKYYWDGSALTTTQPSASGSYVWQAGIASNATDLLTTVEFVKKNI